MENISEQSNLVEGASNVEYHAFKLEQTVEDIEKEVAELRRVSEIIKGQAKEHKSAGDEMMSLKVEADVAKKIKENIEDLSRRLGNINKNG